MKLKQSLQMSLMLLTALMIITACAQVPDGPSGEAQAEVPQKAVTLTFSAAKSLSQCLPEVAAHYARSHPEVKLEFNFGSSGSMRQQIQQGAEVDLYMPAGVQDAIVLQEGGFLAEKSIRNILGNRLALVVPADSALEIGDFTDLTKDSVHQVAVGEPGSVPAGKYAHEVFVSLGILDALKPKMVYAKDVREVLTWTATGNADAGIVYITEALALEQVKIVAKADTNLHTPIVYPGAILKESKHPEAAQAFLDYLCSDAAKPIFEKYGYTFLAE